MIEFDNLNPTKPYNIFLKYYKAAIENNQKDIQAVSISSFNKNLNEVDSRFVNLKYIINNEWIFFSNYNSPKAKSFISHDQISAVFYWSSINTQIRIKAIVKKTTDSFSDNYFRNRDDRKNALAISSDQSQIIGSYDEVLENYERIFDDKKNLKRRPVFWGGYSFTPYYFEFWKGHNSRLNKREAFNLDNNRWASSLIQP